jgi:hypothetical protein
LDGDPGNSMNHLRSWFGECAERKKHTSFNH